MDRRHLLLAILVAAPLGAVAQPARGPGDRAMVGQDFDALSAPARERVRNAFRIGSPQLDEAGTRQRWNAMTAQQRTEALQTRDREQTRDRDRDRDRDQDRDRERDRVRDQDRDRDRSRASQPGVGAAGAGAGAGAGSGSDSGGGSGGGGGGGSGGGGGGGGR